MLLARCQSDAALTGEVEPVRTPRRPGKKSGDCARSASLFDVQLSYSIDELLPHL